MLARKGQHSACVRDIQGMADDAALKALSMQRSCGAGRGAGRACREQHMRGIVGQKQLANERHAEAPRGAGHQRGRRHHQCQGG